MEDNLQFLTAAIQVALDRKAKGDIAFNINSFQLARQMYEFAYAKLEDPKTVGLERTALAWDSRREVTMGTLEALTTVSLELNNYENVHRWANTIIGDRSHQARFMYEMTYYKEDSVLCAVKAKYTAYYAKAVVYQKMGKIRAAIENFQDALVCDGSCEGSYYQLESLKPLKQVEEAYELEMKAQQGIVRRELEQIRKQEEKKNRKKAAKDGRKRAKKARGPGYVVGVGSS